MGLDLSICSKYVWRGLVFDEDAVFQPDFWMQAHGITMTVWGNMDLTSAKGDFEVQFNEWDTIIDFPLKAFGPFSFGGEIWYGSFPSSSGLGSCTAELAAWCSVDVIGSPTAAAYWDVWQMHGVYVNLNLSHAVKIGPGTLSLSAAAGWGDDRHNQWSGVSQAGGWLDFLSDLCLSLPVHSRLTLTPGVHYSRILQDEIRDYYDSIDLSATNVFYSLGVGWAL